ncbi:LytR/AlgR family response regulator transcription factor [Kordiimonas aquimaris]|uniref:LytR/AlgR family response regulator transcription factor n=1 Tax=Kordiimonas aquimaris TaxID=707591 RepID=UPI0021D2518C|nr:LytTR family DNA-binding domain-containing protein [Kordiimonas aquimaris]
MIKAVVLDDEAIIAADVAHQLNARSGWCAEATTTFEEALALLKGGSVQVLFLDIEMPGFNGVELAHNLKRDFPYTDVIFVTAYPEYAVGAFRVSAVDYILKPVARSVLAEACARVEQRHKEAAETAITDEQKFVVRSFGRVDIVPASDVTFVRAERNYVALVCEEREYLYRATIVDIEQALSSKGFMRCHRSFLVRHDLIKSMVRANGVLTKLQLVTGHSVPVGAAYRNAVKDLYTAS